MALDVAAELNVRARELRKSSQWLNGFASGIKDTQSEAAAELRREAHELLGVAARLEELAGQEGKA